MKVLKLLEGKLIEFPQKMLRLDEADYESTIELFLYSVRTVHAILIFPFNGLFPTRKKRKNFDFIYWNSLHDFDIRDKTIIFWPKELEKLSLGRSQDVVIGNRNTTTISYLEEVKGYIMNMYSDRDLCFTVLVTDLHWQRVRRDFERVFKTLAQDQRRTIGVIPYLVRISTSPGSLLWIRKILLGLKERVICLISSWWWDLYFRASLKRGGLK